MTRDISRVVVTTTDGRELAVGESVTGTELDDLVIDNGIVRVLLEPATITEQRGAAHLQRWISDDDGYQYALTRDYGDYTYFTNTPAARPDRATLVANSKAYAVVNVEWDAYSLVNAATFPSGIGSRDHLNALNYPQGGDAQLQNWKKLTTTHLCKTIIVKRGHEGYFTGYHSDPLVGPVASRIPADNNENQSWGERECGPGKGWRVVFSSAGSAFDRYNPEELQNRGLGIDDPSSLGGAEQTVGPWYVGCLPDPANVNAGLCVYAALRQRLQILDYQFGPSDPGVVVVLGMNEAHDPTGVPYPTMLFIGAFVYEADDDLTSSGPEPTQDVRDMVASRCPDDFDQTGKAPEVSIFEVCSTRIRS